MPCSGDGTLRKAKDAYRKWRAGNGLSLHKVQRGILKRGISLCKIGGRIVYSTCSLSPIENEAVVASVLSEAEGSIEIETVVIPNGLISRPGVQTWEVENERSDWYSECSTNPKAKKFSAIPTLFPPLSEEVRGELLKCHRFYPHDNDTGAFFVTIIRKVAPTPWAARTSGTRIPQGRQIDMKSIIAHEKGAEFSISCLSRYGFPEGESRELLMKYLWCSNEPNIPKVWFVSERSQAILNGFTMRNPMKIIGAGTVFASNRTHETSRITVGGFKLAYELMKGHGYNFDTNSGELAHSDNFNQSRYYSRSQY